MIKIVAIKDMSAGNETVGEMWQETKIFNSDNTLFEVMRWVGTNKKVVLSIPDDDQKKFIETVDGEIKF